MERILAVTIAYQFSVKWILNGIMDIETKYRNEQVVHLKILKSCSLLKPFQNNSLTTHQLGLGGIGTNGYEKGHLGLC